MNKIWYVICPVIAVGVLLSMSMNGGLASGDTLAFVTEIVLIAAIAAAPWIWVAYKNHTKK